MPKVHNICKIRNVLCHHVEFLVCKDVMIYHIMLSSDVIRLKLFDIKAICSTTNIKMYNNIHMLAFDLV